MTEIDSGCGQNANNDVVLSNKPYLGSSSFSVFLQEFLVEIKNHPVENQRILALEMVSDAIKEGAITRQEAEHHRSMIAKHEFIEVPIFPPEVEAQHMALIEECIRTSNIVEKARREGKPTPFTGEPIP